MTDEPKQKSVWVARVEFAKFWWGVVFSVSMILWGAWHQFVGEGIREGLRTFIGIGEIVERLQYIEETMPAPDVVDWPDGASGQEGLCTSASCLYRLVAARTKFGDSCGKPVEAQVFLRLRNGRSERISYAPWWSPIELTRTPEEFVVPLVLPETLQSGRYYWRTRITYPSCRGPNEPIPRYSPWFPLDVTQ